MPALCFETTSKKSHGGHGFALMENQRCIQPTEGNIVHINGMSATGTTAGVTVLRPLLKVRKSELIAFADLAHVCYMQDTMMVERDGNLWNSKFIIVNSSELE